MDTPFAILPDWLVWCAAASVAALGIAAVAAMVTAALDLDGDGGP